MSQHKTPLNRDPNLGDWSSATAINTSNWTFAGTNATQIQLARTHDRRNPQRNTFPSAQKASDYIYNGEFSHRTEINTALGSFTLTSNEFAVEPLMRPSMLIACRRQAGLSLVARVVIAPALGGIGMGTLAMPTGFTIDNPSKLRSFFWDTGASTDVDLGTDASAIDYWYEVGLQMPPLPSGAYAMQVRIEVTDVTGTIPAYFDVGEISVVGQMEDIHGVG